MKLRTESETQWWNFLFVGYAKTEHRGKGPHDLSNAKIFNTDENSKLFNQFKNYRNFIPRRILKKNNEESDSKIRFYTTTLFIGYC